jgi:hypothetical protein
MQMWKSENEIMCGNKMKLFKKHPQNKIFLMVFIFLGTVLGELFFSVYAFALSVISLGLFYYLFPTIEVYMKKRKQVNKEKEIARLEKKIQDLRTEVV